MSNQPTELQKAIERTEQTLSLEPPSGVCSILPHHLENLKNAAKRVEQLEKERDEFKRQNKNLLEHCATANGLIAKAKDNEKLTLILQYLNRAEQAEQELSSLRTALAESQAAHDALLLCWNGSLQDTFELTGTMPKSRTEQSELNNKAKAAHRECAEALSKILAYQTSDPEDKSEGWETVCLRSKKALSNPIVQSVLKGER